MDLIAGLPYEDYYGFANSFNQVYELKPHLLQLGFLKLPAGDLIREQVEEYSYTYRSKAPYEVISNKPISAKELARLKMVEHAFNLYYNREVSKIPKLPCRYAPPLTLSLFMMNWRFSFISKDFSTDLIKEDLYRILYLYGS